MDSIGEYLVVHKLDSLPGHKTCRWAVMNKTQDALLGIICWSSGWRQYIFDPESDTTYSAGCLRDIAAFCDANRKTRVTS